MGKIRIGIVGYGNIGRGVEQSIKRNDDMELKAVFTRRDPASVKIQTEGAEVKHFDDMEAMKDDIDVMILVCMQSLSWYREALIHSGEKGSARDTLMQSAVSKV